MMVSKKQIKELCHRITSDKSYAEIQRIVDKNCYSKAYIVGGRVYRTLSEIIHGGDVGSNIVDWDFYCIGLITSKFIPKDWTKRKSFYNKKKNSLQLLRKVKGSATPYHVGVGWGSPTITKDSSKKKDKIDIIGIKDISKCKNWEVLTLKQRRQEYFDAVPLDIQAIALDIENQFLFGLKGIEAIFNRTVKINNRETLNENLNIEHYLKVKSVSLGYASASTARRKQDCNCFNGDVKMLWNKGCQFPKVHR